VYNIRHAGGERRREAGPRSHFFGRDAELEELASITEREHVLLLAPRRVGKTSLLHALVKHVDRQASAIAAYASVAAAINEPQLVPELAAERAPSSGSSMC
jgi:replication-associated recombination protein RarA